MDKIEYKTLTNPQKGRALEEVAIEAFSVLDPPLGSIDEPYDEYWIARIREYIRNRVQGKPALSVLRRRILAARRIVLGDESARIKPLGGPRPGAGRPVSRPPADAI